MPKVSVIIPAYNQAEYLEDALNSVLNQTFQDWECIIVNDGSTDMTREVILSYAKIHSRIRYVEQSNSGLAAARNRGLAEAKSIYIQFLDADDFIDNNKFDLQLALLLQTSDLALSYSDYFSCVEDNVGAPYPGRYLTPKFHSENALHDLILRWETEMSIPVHCFLFDARFFKEHNIKFDERLPNHEDWDCWMNIFSLKPKVYYIDQQLAIYRIHTDSMVYNRKIMKTGFIKAIHSQRRRYNREDIEYKLQYP